MLEPHEGGSDGLWLAWFPGLWRTPEQRVSLLQELAGPRGAWEEMSVQSPLGHNVKKNINTRDMMNTSRNRGTKGGDLHARGVEGPSWHFSWARGWHLKCLNP